MIAGFGLVALPLPLALPYTYRIPESLADRVVPGARVVVPVRQREIIGIVTGLTDTPPAQAARDILAAPDPLPAIPDPLLETARWMAAYYGAPLGLTLKAVLPGALWGESRVVAVLAGDGIPGGLAGDVCTYLERKGGEAPVATIARGLKRPVWDAVNRLVRAGAVTLRVEAAETDAGQVSERVVTLAEPVPPLAERDQRFKRRPAQRAVLEALEELGGSAPLRHLAEQLGLSRPAIAALVEQGLARDELIEVHRDPFRDTPVTPPPPSPTPAQREAIDVIGRAEPGDGVLLFGVTGSGKTLVYLEAVRQTLAEGRGAIILVPEIALTPQTVSRVRGAFGDEVAVLHSALSDGERADAWRALRRGERRVVVGARSAVFAPVERLGLIVVDEEHEGSYKNHEAPRYQARDVALVRARLEKARLVLGSATPSPESMHRVGSRLALVRLPDRAGAQPLPPVELVDLRSAPRLKEARAVPWSERLDAEVVAALARREQVLLLLNRRGFATILQCPACGTVRECPNCSISLTVHQAPDGLRCHYCGHDEPVPSACGQCGSAVQRMKGVGTQQLERFLAARFPEARLARMDLDTTSTRWSHQTILDRVGRGEIDILLGTQMIAKGLDFPNVTLVGVVDADTGLHLPDFRAAERTFQLIAQVAGRAGRGPKGGRVVVQTRNPEHYALMAAARHDAEGFLATELGHRSSPAYPPLASLVNLVISGEVDTDVAEHAGEVAHWCGALVSHQRLAVDVLGPAPCAIGRIKGRWRWHVVLRGEGEPLGRIVRYAMDRLPAAQGVRVVMDRDPSSLL
ncbi:MAG TPA: primosomal protein N' [Gemmatimonadales bacterium]|nr:primosomal protein N' [Gemmatimonadales bacterium]